jgi:uncharacterized protein YqjF (DUF2071 family)
MIQSALQGAGEQLLRPASLISDSFRQRDVLRETAHRPWPLPEEPWLMGQVWADLLFAHWPVAPEKLEPVVPPQLPIDQFDGSAWVGVTPFVVEGLRLRGTAPVPMLSSFPEINVRTYVAVEGKPGIYFFSLDADSRAAVFAARRAYRLPYFKSRISVGTADGEFHYRAERLSEDGPPAEFDASYRPVGDPAPAQPGSLEHWLTERYCLYTLNDRQQVCRGEIHHSPWPLREAWARIRRNSMGDQIGVELEGEPLLHYSARQDVALWGLRPA